MSEQKGIKKLLSKIKIEYLIVVVLAAVCLFIVFNGMKSNEVKETNAVNEYVSSLENKLTKSLSKVSGAGKVNVIISVESKMETVLASVKKTENGTTEEEPFTVGGKTVILTENYPEITGVIIVAEGANNLTVRVSLINATKVFLNIDDDKIQILTMKR